MQRHLERLLWREVPVPFRWTRNGAIIWEGPSSITGEPIVAIAVGLESASLNTKTGAAIQVYYLPQDYSPLDAWALGMDAIVCGGCQHGSPERGGDGDCYVQLGKAPQGIWKCYRRGGYPRWSLLEFAAYCARTQATVRLGAWGDPGATPHHVSLLAVAGASDRLGYSHQWEARPDLIGLCMASVDSRAQLDAAQEAGWATFRVKLPGESRAPGEAQCPASEEAGRKVTCSGCPIGCHGELLGIKPNGEPAITGRAIDAHGARSGRFKLAS